MKFLKRAGNLFIEHTAFLVLAFIAVTTVFSKAIDVGRPRTVFSSGMCFMFAAAVYANSWNNCARDYRSYKIVLRHNPDTKPFNIFKGFVYAVPYAVLNFAFAVLADRLGGVTLIVYKIFNLPFTGFVLDAKNNVLLLGSLGVSAVAVLFSGLGYIVGKTGFSISENVLPKFIYKQNKK